MKLKESHKRVLVLISSLLVWVLTERFVKAPAAHLMRPWVQSLEEGPKLFFSHLIIDSFFPALVCAFYWWFLASRKILEPLRLKQNLRDGIISGFLAGLLISALTIPLAYYRWGFEFLWHPDFWKIAGNLFSNTYEEITYRGLLLLSALYAFRNKQLALILSSAAFGYIHTQYPLELRIYVGIVGYILGWTFLRSRNFAAPVIGHCIADWILDSIFK